MDRPALSPPGKGDEAVSGGTYRPPGGGDGLPDPRHSPGAGVPAGDAGPLGADEAEQTAGPVFGPAESDQPPFSLQHPGEHPQRGPGRRVDGPGRDDRGPGQLFPLHHQQGGGPGVGGGGAAKLRDLLQDTAVPLCRAPPAHR